jgi:hypothetical protein
MKHSRTVSPEVRCHGVPVSESPPFLINLSSLCLGARCLHYSSVLLLSCVDNTIIAVLENSVLSADGADSDLSLRNTMSLEDFGFLHIRVIHDV